MGAAMADLENEDVARLVVRAQDGDRAAFGELAKQFESTVFAMAMRRLRNRTEAAELTQDVFVQAMRKVSQLREPERFAGWLQRIVVRMAINRAVRRPPETACDPVTFGAVEAEHRSPLGGLLDGERADAVRCGLTRLGELDRQTLLAFYFEGQSLVEMSDQFQSPVGTIKRRLHTARNRLREVLGALQPA